MKSKEGCYAEEFFERYYFNYWVVFCCFLRKRKATSHKSRARYDSIENRKMLAIFSNPVITVLAKKVSFDYNQRSIVIEGLINIVGNKGGVSDWVVPEMIIKENSIFISLPTDSNYNMQIGDARFLPTLY